MKKALKVGLAVSFAWLAMGGVIGATTVLSSGRSLVQSALAEAGRDLVLSIALIAVKASLIHFLFGAILGLLIFIFNIERIWTFLSLVTAYVVTFNVINQPQIFDDILWLQRPLLFLTSVLPYWTPTAIAGLLAVFLIAQLAKLKGGRHRWRILTGAGLLLLLPYYVLVVQSFAMPKSGHIPRATAARQEPAPTPAAKRNIIFIGADSLRPDAPAFSRENSPSPILRNFLKESVQFKRVISPIARTHPAFISIFSGKNPNEIGIRDNIQREAMNTDEALKDSLIAKLRQAGYETVFMIDENRFAHFFAGEAFSKVSAPPLTYMNFISPSLMRNQVFFGLFNNPLGFLIFPEVARNQSYGFAYKTRYFTSAVISELERLRAAGKPFALIAHTCTLHSPGNYHYP